jgi:hypothetical protein
MYTAINVIRKNKALVKRPVLPVDGIPLASK